MKQFINVFEDSYELYEYCKEQGYTDCDYDDWLCDGPLGFFEGDPDMIKIDGEVGYFCECGDKVFYYFDEWRTNNAEKILRAFFGAYRTGISLGCTSWIDGEDPEGVYADSDIQNWDAWDKIENGIAWRGGAGYCYWITDWTEWLAMHDNRLQVAV